MNRDLLDGGIAASLCAPSDRSIVVWEECDWTRNWKEAVNSPPGYRCAGPTIIGFEIDLLPRRHSLLVLSTNEKFELHFAWQTRPDLLRDCSPPRMYFQSLEGPRIDRLKRVSRSELLAKPEQLKWVENWDLRHLLWWGGFVWFCFEWWSETRGVLLWRADGSGAGADWANWIIARRGHQ